MLKRVSALLLFAILSSFLVKPALAQANGPVYIVQPGDTLSFIATPHSELTMLSGTM